MINGRLLLLVLASAANIAKSPSRDFLWSHGSARKMQRSRQVCGAAALGPTRERGVALARFSAHGQMTSFCGALPGRRPKRARKKMIRGRNNTRECQEEKREAYSRRNWHRKIRGNAARMTGRIVSCRFIGYGWADYRHVHGTGSGNMTSWAKSDVFHSVPSP